MENALLSFVSVNENENFLPVKKLDHCQESLNWIFLRFHFRDKILGKTTVSGTKRERTGRFLSLLLLSLVIHICPDNRLTLSATNHLCLE